ncbi:hypothetical protein IFM47457_05881 [Aspergillus lentulus]|nr:hypothetical protein IFM47457_05881 [Aspergillus lentulus]
MDRIQLSGLRGIPAQITNEVKIRWLGETSGSYRQAQDPKEKDSFNLPDSSPSSAGFVSNFQKIRKLDSSLLQKRFLHHQTDEPRREHGLNVH